MRNLIGRALKCDWRKEIAMKKELPYFKIENAYGGNQSWFRDPFMNLGGCAAATACDTCIYLAKYKEKKKLYPGDTENFTKEDYLQFSKLMKPYLHPRIEGIKNLKIFKEGFDKYLQDRKEKNFKLEEFSGELPFDRAKNAIRKQIDQEIPVPYLLLKHQNYNFRFYVWHWFLVVGYEEYNEEFFIKVATYGDYRWLSLKDLMDTGNREKGGFIIIQPQPHIPSL